MWIFFYTLNWFWPRAPRSQKVQLMQPCLPVSVLHFKQLRYCFCHARPPIVRVSGATGGHCQMWGWMSRWWASRWWPSLSGRGWVEDPEAASSRASRPWERDPVNRPGGSGSGWWAAQLALKAGDSWDGLIAPPSVPMTLLFNATSSCFWKHANDASRRGDGCSQTSLASTLPAEVT